MIRSKRITPQRCVQRQVTVPSSLDIQGQRFVEWTSDVGYAADTARIRKASLARFVPWCEALGVHDSPSLTHEVLEGYQGHLARFRRRDGELIASSTQMARLNPVLAFVKWLWRQGVIASDPSAKLVSRTPPRKIPERVPSTREIEKILAIPDLTAASGLRDRAMMEVLYATGLRRMELVRLRRADADLLGRSIFVSSGKGARDRIVPLGARAAEWIARYLEHSRPLLCGPLSRDLLFLTDYGEELGLNRLGDIVKRYLVQAGFQGRGCCHLFRHACATHMLEGGADIRYIQAMLGHSLLSTTEIYAHVSIKGLARVHRRTHPSGQILLKGLAGATTAASVRTHQPE